MPSLTSLLTLISVSCFLGKIKEGWCIPASQLSCGSEFLRLQQGASLELHCGTHCDSYTWWRTPVDSKNKERAPIEFSGSILTKTTVGYGDGGQYMCQCLPDGAECIYTVSVLPEMTFSANKPAIHFGDILELSCLVEGSPVNFSAIHNTYGIKVSGQIKKKLDDYTTKTYVTVGDVEEGDYVCSVETYYKGTIVDSVEKRISVQLYHPPSIIYTTEYIVRGEKDFGLPGQLTCTVQTSPDTDTHVSWWANGTQLRSNGKYQVDSLPTDQEDIVRYTLTVNNLQQYDIGTYLCKLSSGFDLEETQSAWIQVDYRNGASSGEQRITQNDGWSLKTIAVCCLVAMLCAVLAFKVFSRYRSKRGRHSPILGYQERGNGHTKHQLDSGVMSFQGSVTKRK